MILKLGFLFLLVICRSSMHNNNFVINNIKNSIKYLLNAYVYLYRGFQPISTDTDFLSDDPDDYKNEPQYRW